MADFKVRDLPKEEVARRAHEIYVERGGGDGHDLEDWCRAEREVAARLERERSSGSERQRETVKTSTESVFAKRH